MYITFIGWPISFIFPLVPPKNIPISSSKSNLLIIEKIGASLLGGLIYPRGLIISYPLTTIELERPWYPTGRCLQFSYIALSGPEINLKYLI